MNYSANIVTNQPLDEVVKHLSSVSGASIDDVLQSEGDLGQLQQRADELIRRAYSEGDRGAEYELQSALYQLLLLSTHVPTAGQGLVEDSAVLFGTRTKLENAFLADEERRLSPDLFAQMPSDPRRFSSWLVEQIDNHRAHHHPVYEDILARRAETRDLGFFLAQEVTMDANTDDFLALLQVGVTSQVKPTIAENYWDELGNGDPSKMHSVLFLEAVRTLGTAVAQGGQLELGALICGNMQILLSLKRRHFYKGVGFFLACEYMAPKRFKSLMTGWRRNELPADSGGYHDVHIPLDVEHAESWLDKVVQPLVAADPVAAAEIVRGLYYRLNTSERYLDMVQPRFPCIAEANGLSRGAWVTH